MRHAGGFYFPFGVRGLGGNRGFGGLTRVLRAHKESIPVSLGSTCRCQHPPFENRVGVSSVCPRFSPAVPDFPPPIFPRCDLRTEWRPLSIRECWFHLGGADVQFTSSAAATLLHDWSDLTGDAHPVAANRMPNNSGDDYESQLQSWGRG